MLLSRLYIVTFKWSHNKFTDFLKFNLTVQCNAGLGLDDPCGPLPTCDTLRKTLLFLFCFFETAFHCIIVPLVYWMPLLFKKTRMSLVAMLLPSYLTCCCLRDFSVCAVAKKRFPALGDISHAGKENSLTLLNSSLGISYLAENPHWICLYFIASAISSSLCCWSEARQKCPESGPENGLSSDEGTMDNSERQNERMN